MHPFPLTSFPQVIRVPLVLGLLQLLGMAGNGAPPDVRLNEFLASNVTIAPDNHDFDDYSDWVELHNPGPSEVVLDRYYLTDDLANPTRWAFPAGTRIPAGGFLVVRADGFDAGPGETFVREFSPWSSFVTRRHHAPFKLAAEGEQLGLFRFDGVVEDLVLVESAAVWRYQDLGTDPGAAWMQPAFDDASWAAGPAELGYGESDEATVVSFGPSSGNKHPATYFRHAFAVTDAASIRQLDLRLLADDGAVVYLNGIEVHRVRMPAGTVGPRTYATASAPEDVFEAVAIPSGLLRDGVNVLAAQVHQNVANSSDLSFAAVLAGRRMQGSPVRVDSVEFGQQYPDVSMGRDPSAADAWVHFGEPTPGAANTTPPVTGFRPADRVTFDPPGGLRPSAVDVALSSTDPAAVIRYTTDGSVPTGASPRYESPLAVTANTVVRARTFVPGRTPGPVVTHSYLVGEPARTLPVVSVTVAPDLFFDDVIGIYDNVHKGREAPIHVEYFHPDGRPGFRVNAGAKIAGENIWRFAQKPLTVTLRGKYGDDLVSQQLFPGEKVGAFAEFVLRNGGDDWQQLMLRDPMTPFLLEGQMPSDVQHYRPVAGFINGAYWGIYNLREKLDPQYFATRYRIPADGYDYLKYAHTIGNVVSLLVETGDADAYRELEEFARTHDLADPAAFAWVEARVDLTSLADFVAAEDFVNNTSWRHNREFWRERRDGARWKWIIPDLDRGFNLNNLNSSLIDNMKADYPLFAAMVANGGFRHDLAQRYAVHLSTTFHPRRIADILARLDAEVLPEIDRHIARWRSSGGIQSRAVRESEMEEIRQFAAGRAARVFDGITAHLGPSGTSVITVDLTPPGSGRLLLHGVPVLMDYTNAVRVFRGLPLDVEVEPAPGYRFAGWSDGDPSGPRREIVLQGDRLLAATCVRSDEVLLPDRIAADTLLGPPGTVYTAAGDVTVEPGVTLTVGPGVTLRLGGSADLVVRGALRVEGTETAPVRIEARTPGRPWGALSFVEATGPSRLSRLVVRDASVGDDPVHLIAAISNFRSVLVIEDCDIEAAATVFARGGDTTLLRSRIHSPYTGDGINVKQGRGRVEDCTFVGNRAPDTDAIDFDGVVDGVIRNNRIHSFQGPNSDGIDVGEGCVNLLVEGNVIFNNSDKGVSVGQASSVVLRRNLIVGCVLGVGIKDTGSLAVIDGNTFARNDVAVAVYEKNLLDGGGRAEVRNSILSRSRDVPVSVDALSTATVDYSLSDTLPLAGTGNVLGDPLFTDPAGYDFSLRAGSPAIDAGDPASGPDPDGSRADIGAGYVFDAAHYPFLPPGVVVIGEVMAHSADGEPDWIELHNAGAAPVDIGGWYLSDSATDLRKYRIADGTVIPGGGYAVFREDLHFGADSPDPGRLTPFALSENGETVRLLGPGGGVAPDYVEEESFGPSRTGESLGRHFKPSTRTYNFIALATPTPGGPNSRPRVGPVVISEIMYHPQTDAAEYLELHNIGPGPVTLRDPASGEPWRFTSGVPFVFPSDPPLTLPPGGRVVLVRDRAAFDGAFAVPDGTVVLAWTEGGLNNGGETLELSEPGDVDAGGERQFIRVDRVNYSDLPPWPAAADGGGSALVRRLPSEYGNDVANWRAAPPTPGWNASAGGFADWTGIHGLVAAQAGPGDDPDADGLVNLLEYALGTRPDQAGIPTPPHVAAGPGGVVVEFPLAPGLSDLEVVIEAAADLSGPWSPVAGTVLVPAAGGQVLRAAVPAGGTSGFHRLRLRQRPP